MRDKQANRIFFPLYRHAVVRFMDEFGAELGQGVFSLDSVGALDETYLSSSYQDSSSVTSKDSNSKGEKENKSVEGSTLEFPALASSSNSSGGSLKGKHPQGYVKMDLSSGGVHLGIATFGIRVSKAVLPKPVEEEKKMKSRRRVIE